MILCDTILFYEELLHIVYTLLRKILVTFCCTGSLISRTCEDKYLLRSLLENILHVELEMCLLTL